MVAAAIDGDGIDVTQWIHQDLIDGNPKKGVKGYAFWRKQHPKNEHPVDFLRNSGVLTSGNQWAANFIMRMRQCSLMRLDTSRMGEVLKDRHGFGQADGVVLDGDYIYILDHRLSKNDAEIIAAVCWGRVTLQWMDAMMKDIQIAFDALENVLDEMYDKAKNAASAKA